MTVIDVLPWLPLLAAGPLLGAALVKAVLRIRGRLDWPEVRLAGSRPISPVVVITAEGITAATAALAGRTGLAAGVMTLAFGVLTAGAGKLLGRRCACFGIAAAVRPLHVVLNAAVTALMAATTVIGWSAAGLPPELGVAVVGGVGSVVAGVALRHVGRRPAGDPEVAPATVSTLTIVVSEGCSACARLRLFLHDYPSSWIDWRPIGDGPDDAWAVAAEHRYPCAVPQDAGGNVVGRPRWGVSSIMELADAVATHRITATGS